MRSVGWIACGLLSASTACGSDATDAPFGCEPTPEFTATADTCEFAVEGNGGPTTIRRWTIEDDTYWDRFALAPDGSIYLFSPDGLGLESRVARLGPDFEFEWSRRLFWANEEADDVEARLHRYAVAHDGIHVVGELRTYSPRSTLSWLLPIGREGTCADPFLLAFGGDVQTSVDSLLRESDSLVLSGITQEQRGFIQRMDLSGRVLDEAEIVDSHPYELQWVETVPHGSDEYLVSHGGLAPVGISGSYWVVEIFDASFDDATLFSHQGGYQPDALGRLHDVEPVRESEANSWDEPPPPVVALELTRLATKDEPAGETRILAIPQPQCGFPWVTIFDESRAIVACSESKTTILGYEGSGEPSWTLELACSGPWYTAQYVFRPDGRLWWLARADERTTLNVAEFD
jgi:hypothetical protein